MWEDWPDASLQYHVWVVYHVLFLLCHTDCSCQELFEEGARSEACCCHHVCISSTQGDIEVPYQVDMLCRIHLGELSFNLSQILYDLQRSPVTGVQVTVDPYYYLVHLIYPCCNMARQVCGSYTIRKKFMFLSGQDNNTPKGVSVWGINGGSESPFYMNLLHRTNNHSSFRKNKKVPSLSGKFPQCGQFWALSPLWLQL